MQKQKLLICGATGFIGRHLVEYFSKDYQYEVHAVYHQRPFFSVENVIWHQADLRNPADVERIIEGMDVVVQAAATTSGAKEIVKKPYLHVTDNAVMNSYLFRAAFSKAVKHVVFFSCSVMYDSNEVALKENNFDANKPLNPRYFGVGHTKLYLEKMCEFYANLGGAKFTAIRHSNIYGPYDKFDLERSHVFGATITKVMSSKKEIIVWGSGEEKRDLLYASDLIRFVDLAIKKQSNQYCLYNCGFGSAISIRELVSKIVALSGRALAIKYDLTKPTIKTNLSLDCSLAKKELGWEPSISLDEGIIKTIEWWRNNIEVKKANVVL